MDLDKLNRHYEMIEKLRNMQEMYQSMEAKALGSQKLTGMPHGTDVNDKVSMLAAELADLSGRIDYLKEQVAESANEIREWTNTIEDERTRMIFRLRYLHGYAWCEVADLLPNRLSEEAVKLVCYRYLDITS